MNALKSFFNTAKVSIVEPGSYKNFLKKPFFSGFWYLYFVLLLTSFVFMIPAGIGLLALRPAAVTIVESVKQEVPNLYPQELVITLENGEVSTNMEGPTVIPLPAEWQKIFADSPDSVNSINFPVENLVTIETDALAEDFVEYRSVFLLTKTSLVMPGKNNTISIFPLKDSEDTVINKQLYDELSGAALVFVGFIPAMLTVLGICLILVLPFLVAFFRLAGYLIYLLITTVLLLLLQLMFKKRLTFEELYRLSMYGLTLPILISLVTFFVPAWIPFLFTIIFLVWMLVILNRLPGKASK